MTYRTHTARDIWETFVLVSAVVVLFGAVALAATLDSMHATVFAFVMGVIVAILFVWWVFG